MKDENANPREDECVMTVLHFLMGRMTQAEAPAFLAHLEECRDCRGYLESLSRLKRSGKLFRGGQVVGLLRRAKRAARSGQAPRCWNCKDPGEIRLLSIRQAARYCKVSESSIYRWMEEGLIEWVYTPGGTRRIYQDSLIAIVTPGGESRPEGQELTQGA